MFADIHHGVRPHPHSTHFLRFVLSALIIVTALFGMTITQRTVQSLQLTSTTLAPVKSLDVAAFGSARTLLIASLEAPAQAVSIGPAAECSPFGALTACASDHFASLGQVSLSAPA